MTVNRGYMEIIDYLNITNVDVEKEIINAITKVKSELKDLNIDRTCKIYSSYLLRELKKKHLLSHIINTKDLGISYEHYFVIVKSQLEEYMIDLTYAQFGWHEPTELLDKGYIKVTKKDLQDYLYKMSKIDKYYK